MKIINKFEWSKKGCTHERVRFNASFAGLSSAPVHTFYRIDDVSYSTNLNFSTNKKQGRQSGHRSGAVDIWDIIGVPDLLNCKSFNQQEMLRDDIFLYDLLKVAWYGLGCQGCQESFGEKLMHIIKEYSQ